ncbi:M28 family peptidase [uncultured Paraglaciecola sp.]|uniref:M28 family peptidase n=1 Tax=uncultured Paraglaciecola sp. TaxID=1765024 RepID=UPI002628432A|nr:M28 family peptidase [uncultured Paraglaciecola sp.]
MRRLFILLILCSMSAKLFANDLSSLIKEQSLIDIAREVSGSHAKRNLDQMTLFHRMRGSKEFNLAADHVLKQLRSYGYKDANLLTFPADGKTLFGTQKSRLAWNVSFAELWELEKRDEKWHPSIKMADWSARPLTLVQDSDSVDTEAYLVDIGEGTSESDYQDKKIKGKIVLTSSQPAAVEALAIVKYGAVGVLSYAANQKSAWWQLDDNLVRWGHLSSFRDYPTFGFMTTLGEARRLKSRLGKGEKIRFHAKIKARREVGEYQIVNARIDGSDPQLTKEEIVFSCHLDHPRPGANDNASGCVAILEVARTLKVLIDSGRIPPPRRSIRFIWPAEIEASLILLNAKPDLAKQFKHVVHMDMVGGGPVTKAVFRLSRGPSSVADISGDIAFSIIDFVNKHTLDFAGGVDTPFKLISSTGGREPLLAQKEWLSVGSDHDVFASGSWAIPITYMHDWPDRYIHTTKDLAANIDPTKLKRAAFIGLVQATILANLGANNEKALIETLRANLIKRAGNVVELLSKSRKNESLQAAISRGYLSNEKQIINSISTYSQLTDLTTLHSDLNTLKPFLKLGHSTPNTIIYRRNKSIKGTMNGFGYSYLKDKLDHQIYANLKLPKQTNGYEKSYEALNLINGKRSLTEIHDRLSYQFGSVSKAALAEYFTALASINVIYK